MKGAAQVRLSPVGGRNLETIEQPVPRLLRHDEIDLNRVPEAEADLSKRCHRLLVVTSASCATTLLWSATLGNSTLRSEPDFASGLYCGYPFESWLAFRSPFLYGRK